MKIETGTLIVGCILMIALIILAYYVGGKDKQKQLIGNTTPSLMLYIHQFGEDGWEYKEVSP